jgi:hypothetical protein
MLSNQGKAFIDRSDKLRSETGRLALIPDGSFCNIRLRLVAQG